MQDSDWDKFLLRLVEQTVAAIEQFASEHSDEEVCYFAYDSEPDYGYVLTCFNTSRSSLESVHQEVLQNTASRKQWLDSPNLRDSAYCVIRSSAMLPFCNNTGDFKYQGFTEISFPEWLAYAESSDYPPASDSGDDYLQNRVSRMFADAFDQLIEGGHFSKLKLASPMLLGFGFHDEDQFVLNMINLPPLLP